MGVLRFPSFFDWQGVSKPQTAYSETVVYEGHVKGLTALNLEIPQSDRGTFLGLCSDEFISHLKKLGVTALELLPICYVVDEDFLLDAGLTNYWGYNPGSFFALSERLAARNSQLLIRDQFKTAIRELHRAGIEVILDVVYNHTGEGSFKNPKALSLRGLDEKEYYRGTANKPVDYTGCGNTLNTDSVKSVKLVCDSLRYWAEEMQVDGFRFDLTSAIFRSGPEFSANHPLAVSIMQDPILSTVKLIAEPWDATAEGYKLGGYPRPWREWNDRFRDTSRRFWRGDGGILGDFVNVFAGSSATFSDSRTRSVNFITAHDGFTLRDLVSYREKRNFENAQSGEDGANSNWSFNSGVEGETSDKKVNELRLRQQKNLLATLFLAKGIPMLLGGDEFSRTQKGNNNAYCHDTEWNYLDWAKSDESSELIEWISMLSKFREKISSLCDDKFYESSEVNWLSFNGTTLSIEEWRKDSAIPFAMMLNNALESRSLIFAFNPTEKIQALKFPAELQNPKVHCVFSSDSAFEENFDNNSGSSSILELLPSSITAFFNVGEF